MRRKRCTPPRRAIRSSGASDEARGTYARLAERREDDPWHFIGLSGQQLRRRPDRTARSHRRSQAVQMAGGLSEAHYQVGLVLAKRQDWREAAEAFDRAVDLNPANAYAHYYGGLMQYRAGRPDRMANHFEQFLKLAPEAPERPEVLQIMRTVRGGNNQGKSRLRHKAQQLDRTETLAWPYSEGLPIPKIHRPVDPAGAFPTPAWRSRRAAARTA